ncbi:deaminase [Microlunatus elymi]|uniref:Deaminase n=1 Tax=Microlunatus elymi TaxID=2596828 RepID=A0A516PUN3_9ACTN|nr:dihydrofolate reductase family protein [Microlunatus elymi]QDP94830.1 deaminase [Microlunatus elymi]
MGRIVINSNTTLDGVSQDPSGDEGFGFGGWFTRVSDPDREAWAKIEFGEALETSAFLLGGRTYGWFADRWLGRPGEWAERLFSLPKYVVRSTPARTDWGPTTELTGDLVSAIDRLRQQIDGDVVVLGSSQLAQFLLEHELVDELRLFLYPHLVGSGNRLFGELTSARALRLVDASAVGNLVKLTYDL